MQEESDYGYSFYGNRILVILTSNRQAMEILKEARRADGVSLSFPADGFPDCLPEEVYFSSEDTWYSVRYHSPAVRSDRVSLIVHGVKPMFMASSVLKEYRKEYDNGQLILYSR